MIKKLTNSTQKHFIKKKHLKKWHMVKYFEFKMVLNHLNIFQKRMFHLCKTQWRRGRLAVKHICGICVMTTNGLCPLLYPRDPIGQPPHTELQHMAKTHRPTCCSNFISI